MQLNKTTLALISFLLLSSNFWSQEFVNDVHVTGAMKNVMRKGELFGTIHLDSLKNKPHLYAVGPLEYLKGEILIVDGKSYISKVDNNGQIDMQSTFDAKAPFLVYAQNKEWTTLDLPPYLKNDKDLEDFLNLNTQHIKRPFVFLLKGQFKTVNFHIQNLADGTIVRSPQDAHQGQGKYINHNTEGLIVGFFSTEHQSIFTHHDSYIHLHYINADNTEMGHVDALELGDLENIQLLIPSF